MLKKRLIPKLQLKRRQIGRFNKMVLVTSGAVAAGIAELGISPIPKDVAFLQAASATG